MKQLPLGEMAGVTALLSLQAAAEEVCAEVVAPSERPMDAATRLEQTYGTINAPIGIRAQALIKLLRAVGVAHQAVTADAPQLSPYLKQAVERPHRYGPPLRQAPGPVR